MRKLIRLLAVISLVAFTAGNAYAIPNPSDPGDLKGPIGNRMSTPRKVYQLVRNGRQGDFVGIVSAEVVIWDSLSDDGVTVGLTTTSHDGLLAGIAVTSIETADVGGDAFGQEGRRNWGYIQVYGPALAKVTPGAVTGATAGWAFYTSVDSGAISVWENIASVTLAGDGQLDEVANARKGGFIFDASTNTEPMVQVFVSTE